MDVSAEVRTGEEEKEEEKRKDGWGNICVLNDGRINKDWQEVDERIKYGGPQTLLLLQIVGTLGYA